MLRPAPVQRAPAARLPARDGGVPQPPRHPVQGPEGVRPASRPSASRCMPTRWRSRRGAPTSTSSPPCGRTSGRAPSPPATGSPTAVRTHLFGANAAPDRRRSGQVSRLVKRLHLRGLVAKIPRSRRWRVTHLGQAVLSAAIQLREDQKRPTAYWSRAEGGPRTPWRIGSSLPRLGLRLRLALGQLEPADLATRGLGLSTNSISRGFVRGRDQRHPARAVDPRGGRAGKFIFPRRVRNRGWSRSGSHSGLVSSQSM